LGARVAEFPVTVDAARRQRELSMPILVGAPNIVRGGSQSGNLDARELIELGLADIICADYHVPSLLPAAFRLVDEQLMALPAAIRMLTLNAARAVGLEDRGAVEPGLLADLVLARRSSAGVPCVEQVFRHGRPVFSFLQTTPAPALAGR
jgi:alpha-D-ribose 1-methylphosphonate 5-triphosphate diphosphatase